MKDELLLIFNKILENRNREQLTSISEDMNLRDLGFDSLDLAELTARIDAEFDIDIFEDGMVFTVGDILKKISK